MRVRRPTPELAALRRVSWRCLLVAAASAGLLHDTQRARAYCLTTTIDPPADQLCSTMGHSASWQRSCISFSVLDPGPALPPLEQVRDVIDHSFATWTAVTCNGQPLPLEIKQTEQLAQCPDPEYNQHAGNANTVMFVTNWEEHEAMSPDAFGVTLVALEEQTGEIYDADILINETLGRLTICGRSCPSGAVDLQNVMTHEAGHFFGLGHSENRAATMSATASIGETSKRVLNDDDRAGLCAIYGARPAARCADSDFTPRHGFSVQCAAMQQTMTQAPGGCCQVAPGRGASPSQATLCTALTLAALLRLRRRTREQ
jgi:hypothetical protein